MPSLLGDRYLITKILGQGGFGTTYLAEDTHSSNLVCVIKQLNPNTADVETAKRLFQREAQILNQLQSNQQIPKFYNYFEEDNNYYLVQEYVPGKTLDQITQKPWTQYRVVILLWEILSILEPLHEKNIIHRDIKPSNLMQRDKDRKLVLIDFGAVKQINPSTQPKAAETRIITLGYSPPEQEIGVPCLNSDIYALGMTAIQLLTGISPRNINRDIDGNLLWYTGTNVSSALAAILNKMVCLYARDRYQSVEEVLRDLNGIEELTALQTGSTQPQSGSSQPSLPGAAAPLTQPSKSRFQIRLWHVPAALLGLIIALVFAELIFPFVRPWWYVRQGNQFLDTRQLDAAIEQFNMAIDLKPDFAEALQGRANAHFSKGGAGEYLRAIADYELVTKIQPRNVKAWTNKGTILRKLRRYQEALDAHEEALKIDPKNVEALKEKGLAYLGLNKPDEARKAFQLVRNFNPSDTSIWLTEGFAVEQQNPQEADNYYQAALSAFTDRLRKEPKNPELLATKGTVLLKLKKPQEALDACSQALAVDRNFYEALICQGNSRFALGNLEEALTAFDNANKLRDDDYQLSNNRGAILANLGRLDEALKSFDRAIELNPGFADAWEGKGSVLGQQKKYQEALKIYNKLATELKPKDPFIWVNRASILQDLGNNEEALNSYNQAIELDGQKVLPPEVLQERDRLRQKLGR